MNKAIHDKELLESQLTKMIKEGVFPEVTSLGMGLYELPRRIITNKKGVETWNAAISLKFKEYKNDTSSY